MHKCRKHQLIWSRSLLKSLDRPRRRVGVVLLIFSILYPNFSLLIQTVFAATSPWTQTEWSGGIGQTNWSDSNKYSSSTNIDTSTTGQISLASEEELTNTGFETDLSSWSANWWEIEGQTVVAAYQPKGAASAAASYVNLANPGTNDLTEGLAPNWTAARGWHTAADGNDYYLQTGIVPNANYTIVLRFAEVERFNTNYFIGNATTNGMWLGVSTTSLRFNAGSTRNYADTTTTAGVVAVKNGAGYLNGAQVTDQGGTVISATELYIMTLNNAGTPAPSSTKHKAVLAVAIYSTALDDTQVATLTSRVNDVGETSATRDTGSKYSGSASAKLVSGDNADYNFTQTINVGDTNPYNLEAYAYTNGSAVTASDLELFSNGSTVPTTYTSVGGGWYKLTGTLAGVSENRTYGVQVKSGKTVYVDEMSLNNYSSVGTLTSSIFDSEFLSGSFWGSLIYNATIPVNTSVSVKARTSNSSSMVGATDFSSCNAITSGDDISSNNCVTDSHRYIQYQVALANSDSFSTPVFEDISISFDDYDSTPPSISLNSITDPTTDKTPTITGSTSDNEGTISTVEFQMDSTAGSWTACTADDGAFDEASESFSCTPSTLADGLHTIYVRSTDNNGNTTAGGSEVSDSFVIDATAPSAPGTPSTDTPTNSTSQVWVWSAATDTLSGVASYAWRVIDEALNTVASGTTSLLTATTNLTNGTYTFFVKAIDNAGNEGAESQSQVVVDTTIPSVSLSALSPDPTTDKTPTIIGTATDTDGTISSVVFQMDSTSGNWTPCTAEDSTFDEQSETFACTPTELSDGAHTIYVKVADNAYNISGIVSQGFSVDTTSPQAVSISSPGGDQYLNSERPTFSFKPTSDISGIKNYKIIVDNPGDKDFSIDSIDPNRTGTFEAANYTIIYENFSDSDPNNDLIKITTKSSRDWGESNNDGKVLEGVVNWRVVAVDNAGNEGVSSSKFFVDRTNPRVNFSQINQIPLDSQYFATTDRTPTIFGKITDVLSGPELSDGQLQTEDGPKVASGPKSVELVIEKESATGYSPYLIETINLNTPWWTCGDTEISDNSDQKCDKYLPFEFVPREEMEPGTYKITLKGKDRADNASGETSFTLDITTISQITTPEERQEIEDEIAQLPEEEKPSSLEEVEITKPVEPTTTRELADQGREVADTVIDTTSSIVSSTLSAIGNGISSVIGFTVKTIGSVARAGYSVVAFVAKTTVNIASLAIRTTADLAGLIINQTTSALAFGFNQAGRAISWTFNSIGDGYNYLAGRAPGVAGQAMTSLGSGVSGFTSALSSSFNAISDGTKQIAGSIGSGFQGLFGGARNTVVAIGGGIQAVGRGTQSWIANVLFIVGEKTQGVSDTVGLAFLKMGYVFLTEPTTISDVQVVVLSPTSAKVTWTTNHPATGKVNYGSAPGWYEKEQQTTKRSTYHEFIVTDLTPDTEYHYEVMSQNKNYVYDANRQFKTPGQ